MAISWLSALKAIPWGNVIEHAPNVIDKARDLLDRQRKPASTVQDDFAQHSAKDLSPHEQLESRLIAALSQIKLVQQKNDHLEQRLVNLVNLQEAAQKDFKLLRRTVRWVAFSLLILVLGNFVLWYLLFQTN
jgi:hypothetical protein